MAEPEILEPGLPAGNLDRPLGAEVIQVEEEEVVFEAGAGVGHGVVVRLAGEDGEIVSTDAGD